MTLDDMTFYSRMTSFFAFSQHLKIFKTVDDLKADVSIIKRRINFKIKFICRIGQRYIETFLLLVSFCIGSFDKVIVSMSCFKPSDRA